MIFTDRDDAKEFLIGRISNEAERQGSPLAEIEKKMLLWTEVYPIRGLPASELQKLAEEFSEQFDDAEFEAKVIGLAKSAFAREETEDVKESDRSAYQLLEKEDHYLNIMLGPALGAKARKKLFGIF